MGLSILAGLLLFAQGMGSGSRPASVSTASSVRNLKPPRFHFVDVAAQSGLNFQNAYGGKQTKQYILEMTGNGVGILDVDNDGFSDIVFADGKAPALFRNRGDSTFTRVNTFRPKEWGQGLCAGDYDNDGWTDLLLTYYGHSVLYRNRNGAFTDVTEAAGLPTRGKARFSSGCTFFDYDRDGKLDLLVSNYVAFDLESARFPGASKFCTWKALSVFCGPRGFPTDTPILYHNEGDGKFRDVTQQALKGIEGLHYGLGVVSTDFDDDGWPDAYIACDSTPGILLHNNRDGTFTDVAVTAGAAYGPDGGELGSMGLVAVDMDGDGRIDIVKTNFIEETPSLYKNHGDLFFTDATVESGLAVDATAVGWGVVAADLDHDGNPDLVMANGHIYPELGAAYAQSKSVYWNGGGIFARASAAGLDTPKVSRGMAAGDLNNNGVLELVVSNMNGAPSLYRSQTTVGNAVILRLEGSRSNRSAIGARVVVTDGGRKQTREVQSGGSYASHNDFGLHFGLGKTDRVGIEISWPSGARETFQDVAANHTIFVKEGSGIVRRTAWRR
jgi:hypothetical protein